MRNAKKRLGLAALAGLTFLAAAPLGAAVPVAPPRFPVFTGGTNNLVNRNWLVGPGLTLNQAAYNLSVAGRAYSYIPPYMLGYNPYPQVVNYGPLYNPTPYYNPYVNPYVNPTYGNPYANPYASLYSTGGLPATAGYGGASAMSSSTGLPATSGYDAGYGGYGSPYGDPYGGGLRGTADVINASARAGLPVEGARLMHERVKQAKIENRRRLFDEIMYERAHTPSYVERQEKQNAQEVRYSQNLAQPADITSARALNILLRDAKKLLAQKIVGPTIELDPEVLQQINVRGESGQGNIGPLKSKRPLTWPSAFDNLKDSAEIRGTIDAKLVAAVDQAATGRVDTGIINSLKSLINDLHRLLSQNVNGLGSNEYIRAKRFLNELDDAVTALQDPNVGGFFNQTFIAKGRTVQELVEYMTKKGLQFAPATLGDENAYQVLYQALAAYDIGARQKAGVATAKE